MCFSIIYRYLVYKDVISLIHRKEYTSSIKGCPITVVTTFEPYCNIHSATCFIDLKVGCVCPKLKRSFNLLAGRHMRLINTHTNVETYKALWVEIHEFMYSRKCKMSSIHENLYRMILQIFFLKDQLQYLARVMVSLNTSIIRCVRYLVG